MYQGAQLSTSCIMRLVSFRVPGSHASHARSQRSRSHRKTKKRIAYMLQGCVQPPAGALNVIQL
jgi:hypothetical protein